MNSVYDTMEAQAVVTAPVAGQVLASIAGILSGFYRFDVSTNTSGTTTGTDSDNVALNVPGDPAYVVPNAQGNTAVSALTQTWYAELTAPLTTVTLTAIANGGAAAAYHVALKATLWPRAAVDRSI